jgi:hypothetical protein
MVRQAEDPRETATTSNRKACESCGNAGAVESVESQHQASHAFHEPLGNPARSRRDSHISTAPATRADGKMQNPKQVFHFSTATDSRISNEEKPAARRAA